MDGTPEETNGDGLPDNTEAQISQIIALLTAGTSVEEARERIDQLMEQIRQSDVLNRVDSTQNSNCRHLLDHLQGARNGLNVSNEVTPQPFMNGQQPPQPNSESENLASG